MCIIKYIYGDVVMCIIIYIYGDVSKWGNLIPPQSIHFGTKKGHLILRHTHIFALRLELLRLCLFLRLGHLKWFDLATKHKRFQLCCILNPTLEDRVFLNIYQPSCICVWLYPIDLRTSCVAVEIFPYY